MAELYVEVQGAAEGEAVLLCSGLGGSAGYWAPQVPALVEAGYRVITYDQRGTGRSLEPLPPGYRIEHMAQDLDGLLAGLGVARCHVVGHALGGLAGLQLALDHPARVASLTLINAWAAPNPHSARCFDARLALLDNAGPQAYVEAQPIFLYPAAWAAEHAGRVEEEVAHALKHFPGASTMHARIGALRRFNVADRLSEISAPTLVSVALDDVLVPSTCSAHLAQGIKGCVYHAVPHGAHAHNITQAPAFNQALLAFLDGHRQGPGQP